MFFSQNVTFRNWLKRNECLGRLIALTKYLMKSNREEGKEGETGEGWSEGGRDGWRE